MTDTIKNIKLPANQWLDIYDAAGIPVGTRIIIENLTQTPTKVYAGASVPADAEKDSDDGYFSRLLAYEEKENNSGDAGAWAYSATVDGLVNVSIATGADVTNTLPVTEDFNNKTYNTDAWFRNKVSIDDSIFHGMFTYNVPADTWYEMIDDVEQPTFVSAVSTDGKMVLSSGALNEKRQLRSFRNPRYEPNRGHLYSTSLFFPDKDAAAERTFGIFTKEAGVGFRLRSGTLYALRRTTVQGVTTDYEEEITVPAGIDLEKGNVYDVQFQWRGVGSYFFYIDLKVVHVLNLLGTLDELSVFNPAIPCAFESINQGDSTHLVVGCVDITSEGGKNNGKTYGSLGTSTESGSVAISGFNVPLLVVRNKSMFGTLINTRDVLALLATAYGDQRCLFRIWATRDETAITLNDQVWQDFRDEHIEFIEYDNPDVANPITFDTTKASLIFGSRADQDQSYATSALFEGRTDIYLTPGDIFVFTMHRETGGAVNAGVTFEFAEAI